MADHINESQRFQLSKIKTETAGREHKPDMPGLGPLLLELKNDSMIPRLFINAYLQSAVFSTKLNKLV